MGKVPALRAYQGYPCHGSEQHVLPVKFYSMPSVEENLKHKK